MDCSQHDLKINLLKGNLAPRYTKDTKNLKVEKAVITEQGMQRGLPLVDVQLVDEDGNKYFFCLSGQLFKLLADTVDGVNLRNHGTDDV